MYERNAWNNEEVRGHCTENALEHAVDKNITPDGNEVNISRAP